jgi:hypothetical protein
MAISQNNMPVNHKYFGNDADDSICYKCGFGNSTQHDCGATRNHINTPNPNPTFQPAIGPLPTPNNDRRWDTVIGSRA